MHPHPSTVPFRHQAGNVTCSMALFRPADDTVVAADAPALQQGAEGPQVT